MKERLERGAVSFGVVVAGAVAVACLTWLCVGTFGAQGPVTAAIAVILVELFLACFGVIAAILAARLSDKYLERETRWPEQPAGPWKAWLWRPLWQPTARWTPRAHAVPTPSVPVEHWLKSVYDEMQPASAVREVADVVPFPAGRNASPEGDHRRRAA